MSGPDPDPRTDGVGDGGKRELPPLSEEEIAAGVAYDRKHRARQIAEYDRYDREHPGWQISDWDGDK